MRWIGGVVMALVLLGGQAGLAHAYQRSVHFHAQGDEATVSGTVEGDEVVQYRVPAKMGHFLLVGGKAKSARVSFWVRDPGGVEVYNSQIQNAVYVGRPGQDGSYVVGVFLRKTDAARGHAAFFRLRFLFREQPDG